MTPEQLAEKRFAVFRAPAWGFRALAVTLRVYQSQHEINTIRGIISRFAPSNENDTKAYIAAVSYGCHRDADQVLDLTDPDTLRPICKAIAIHESGSWVFTDADLMAGINMAEAIS